MKRAIRLGRAFAYASIVVLTSCTGALHAQPSPDVVSRPIDIYSDGTRLSGDLFHPKDLAAGERLPAIVLCHGWGGVKSHLNVTYAPAFASAGFVVLTFDYRGWGESDSRMVLVGEPPEVGNQGRATVEVEMIRELVDPFDQLEDIRAALDWLEGEPIVDPERIGIWGTSFGGGLVVWTAAHDPRVKVVVSQVGAMDARGSAAASEGGLAGQHDKEIARARGDIPPVPQGEDVIEGLRGTPYMSRFARYAPIELADRLSVPTLLIDAEDEELFDRFQHSALLYERIKDRVPSAYHVEAGIAHYGIYRERYAAGMELARRWFVQHLK